MFVHRYVPKDAQGKNAKLDGYIDLICPTHSQRFKYFEMSGFNVDKDGNMDTETMGMVNAASKLLPIVKEHVKELKLTIIDDNTTINSVDELEVFPELQNVQLEIAMMILQGFRPSPKPKP